jgi:hypothetical protein
MSTIAFDESPSSRSIPSAIHWLPEMMVLSHLLDQHPRRVTLQELFSEVTALEKEALSRAVDNLAAACFVHREGAALTPAPAVVSFDQAPLATEF